MIPVILFNWLSRSVRNASIFGYASFHYDKTICLRYMVFVVRRLNGNENAERQNIHEQITNVLISIAEKC